VSSEVYKLLEAMAWEAARGGGDPPGFDELTAAVAAAQEPDGYLNTRFGYQGPAARYTDLPWGHERYCYGHLIQAAVARLRTAGDDRLVAVARRAADHVCDAFGPAGRSGVCGHPEIEMALVELFRATGEERYLEQARRFVERRGHGVLGDIELGPAYFQDDVPVRRSTVLRGHAVRALYLACGAVDVAVELDDAELLEAVAAQLRATLAARTYLTGGMGSRHTGESFGDDFELPPDRAYSETCAGVAAVMLAWRLLLATGDAAHADLAERVLYNVVATSPAADGRAFFYANPLHQRVPGAPADPDAVNPRAAASLRSAWFSVSCCPPNVARTMASLAAYLATADEDGLQLHQLAPCTVRTWLPGGRRVGVRVETGYPWTGEVTVRVTETAGRWRLSLRVPAWADGAVVRAGGERLAVAPGYAVLDRHWSPGDQVRLELPVAPRWTRADPRIDAVRGCVAVERGPLVYCAESAGQPGPVDLEAVAVDTSVAPVERPFEDGPPGALALDCAGRAPPAPTAAWPYGGGRARVEAAAPLTLVPYHLWGNRGPATMRVWLPEAADGEEERP
jgi:uncharacterized protein